MTVLKTSLRSFFAHTWRMVLSGMAIVLSVAFVCGTLVFTATMDTSFDRLFADTASDVMISSHQEEDSGSLGGSGGSDTTGSSGVPGTVPAKLAEEVPRVAGVQRVTGTVESTDVVAVGGDNEDLTSSTGSTTVSNWSRVERRAMTISEGHAPHGSGEVMVDADTAEENGLALGADIRLVTSFGDYTVTVTGIAEFTVTNPGTAVFFTDTGTAQEYLLGGQDAYTTVYVDSDGTRSDKQLKQAIAEDVPALGGANGGGNGGGNGGDYRLLTAAEYEAENENEIAEILDVLEYVLLGFAGISLLVGVFLIVNTFSMLVAQRTREIGLMRAIGASRGQVKRSVLTEALLLGVAGSAIGFVLGIGLAVALMRVLSALGVELSTGDLTVNASVPVIGTALGVAVALVAAYLPARRAAGISPMAALREAGMPGDVRAGRVRAALGGVLTLAGLAALAATAGAETSSAGATPLTLGIVLSLLGLILAAPALVSLVVRALGAVLLRGFGPVGRLAERNALRNPRRTGATASALMIGLALVTGISVIGSSIVASATQEIDDVLGADFVIGTSNDTQILPAVTDAVRGVDELDHVTEVRGINAEITAAEPGGDPGGGGTFDAALTAAGAHYPDDVSIDTVSGSFADVFAAGSRGIAVDADTADSRGIAVGDELTVGFQHGRTATLTVMAITSSDLTGGTLFVSTETARRYLSDEAMPLPTSLVASADEDRLDQAHAALERALAAYPQVEVLDKSEYKDLIQEQVSGLLNMIYGLLALAVIVAVLGVINTLALSVIERTREIGLMRAIGLSRRQLRRMIHLESIIIALFGALMGTGLGLAWGASAHQLLVLEDLPVLAIPWTTIAWVFAGSALVGVLAALIPAFRAGRMNVLTAIATE